MRNFCKKTRSSPKTVDALEKVQQDAGRQPLKIVCENSTRWNSFFDSIKRYLQLCLLFAEELTDFNWDSLKSTCKLSQPFKECTMKLQEASASAETTKKVFLFLQSRVQTMNSDVKDVLKK